VAQEELGALLSTRSFGADDDDVLLRWNFVETFNERPQRNVVYARYLPLGDFVRLSHIEEKEVRVVQVPDQLVAGDC
jgi:hypothetical protein